MKTAVITGGNSGMGKAVATVLAKKGYRVIIHGRDSQKTILAAEDIKKESGSEKVEYIVADVSVIKGMKELAEAIRQKTTSIEVFMLSTGVILPNQIITADGLEAGFAIQYLSRFALTQMLMPELRNGKARIIVVGAPKLSNAEIFFDDIALKNNFTMMKAMGQEMYANHLFVQEFAKLHPDNEIVMNLVHPGIAKTNIMRSANFFLKALVVVAGKQPEALTGNFVYLATDPAANFSGYFLKKPGKPEVKDKLEYDADTAQRLWNRSLDLIYPVASASR